MTKNIHILHHAPPKEMNFWDVLLEGWHSKYGKEIAKRSDFEVQCWLPNVARKQIEIQKDGITYRTFSALQPNFYFTFSYQILRELKRLAESDKLIVHVYGERSVFTYSLCWFHYHYRKFPLVVQHLGAGGTRGHVMGPFVLPMFGRLESSAFKNVDLFLVQSQIRKKEIIRAGVGHDRVKIRGIGVDFETFKPQDKIESRKILGLPLEKILILYVGRFFKDKGLDVIIDAVNRLKSSYDIDLVAVGGFANDPLWPVVKSKLKYYATRIPANNVVRYYGAADISCQYLPHFSEYTISTAIEESLACGVPVITNSLINVGPDNIIPLLGCAPRNLGDFERCLKSVIENLPSKSEVRTTAHDLVSWDGIIPKTVNDYSRLLKFYYGDDQ
jgi:glycosyltransferase involved in cell wall biosynthesis